VIDSGVAVSLDDVTGETLNEIIELALSVVSELAVCKSLQISLSGELGLVSSSLSDLLLRSELLFFASDGSELVFLGLLLLVDHSVELLSKHGGLLLLESSGFLSNSLLLLPDLINVEDVGFEMVASRGFDPVKPSLLGGKLVFLPLNLLLPVDLSLNVSGIFTGSVAVSGRGVVGVHTGVGTVRVDWSVSVWVLQALVLVLKVLDHLAGRLQVSVSGNLGVVLVAS